MQEKLGPTWNAGILISAHCTVYTAYVHSKQPQKHCKMLYATLCTVLLFAGAFYFEEKYTVKYFSF